MTTRAIYAPLVAGRRRVQARALVLSIFAGGATTLRISGRTREANADMMAAFYEEWNREMWGGE